MSLPGGEVKRDAYVNRKVAQRPSVGLQEGLEGACARR